MRLPLFALLGGLALAAAPAAADIVTIGLNVSFADAPYTYDFGGGNSVTFTALPDFFNPAGISTGGTTQVLSLGAPFFDPPRPTSFFTDRGGEIGPDTLGIYLPYAEPAAIPFSISRGIVGFRFDLGQGFQYGYADSTGTFLTGIRFETDPGVGVGIAAVPEPASWALMIAGFGLVGGGLRSRRVATA